MTLKGQTRDPNTLKVQYLENYLLELETSFGTRLSMGHADRTHRMNDLDLCLEIALIKGHVLQPEHPYHNDKFKFRII